MADRRIGPGRGRHDNRVAQLGTAAALAVLRARAGVALAPGARRSRQSLSASIQAELDARGKLEQVRGREQVADRPTSARSAGGSARSTREIGVAAPARGRVQSTLDATPRAARARPGALPRGARALRPAAEGAAAVTGRARGAAGRRSTSRTSPTCCRWSSKSDGFSDLLVRADYMSRIGEQDSADRRPRARAEARVARKKRLLLEALKKQRRGGRGGDRGQAARARSRRAPAIESREADLAAARDAQARHARRNVREHRHELEGDLRALAGRLGAGHRPSCRARARCRRDRSARAAAATSGR